MGTIAFKGSIDMNSLASPSSGYVIGYDVDGVLKQKNIDGVVSPFIRTDLYITDGVILNDIFIQSPPTIASIDSTHLYAIYCVNKPVVSSLYLPNLIDVDTEIIVNSCDNINSVDFPVMTQCGTIFIGNSCPLLSTVNMSGLQQTFGSIDISQASEIHLENLISGTLSITQCPGLTALDLSKLESSITLSLDDLISLNLNNLKSAPEVTLNCSSLSSINISNLGTASSLSIDCGLTALDISSLRNYNDFNLGCVSLQSLNLSGLTACGSLSITNKPNLNNLQLSNLVTPNILNIESTSLPSLNLSGLKSTTSILFTLPLLSNLNLDNLSNAQSFDFSGNTLTSLNLNNLKSSDSFSMASNSLSSMQLGITSSPYINIYTPSLTSIGLTTLSSASVFGISSDVLTSLDLSSFISSDNSVTITCPLMTSLNFSSIKSAQSIAISGNSLVSLDINSLNTINTLSLNCSSLQTINMSGVANLDTQLSFGGCPSLVTLDVSGLGTASATIALNNANLANLYISNLVYAPQGIEIQSTGLTSLDLSSLSDFGTHLYVQNCSYLQTLNLNGLTSSPTLYLTNVNLTNLYLDNLTTVGNMELQFANITYLNLSSLTSFNTFYIVGPSLQTLDLSGLTSSPNNLSLNYPVLSTLILNNLVTANRLSIVTSGLTGSLNLSSLKSATSVYVQCYNMTSIDITNLTTITGYEQSYGFSIVIDGRYALTDIYISPNITFDKFYIIALLPDASTYNLLSTIDNSGVINGFFQYMNFVIPTGGSWSCTTLVSNLQGKGWYVGAGK